MDDTKQAQLEAKLTGLHAQHEWLQQNKDTAPVQDVRAAKITITETIREINNFLETNK